MEDKITKSTLTKEQIKKFKKLREMKSELIRKKTFRDLI